MSSSWSGPAVRRACSSCSTLRLRLMLPAGRAAPGCALLAAVGGRRHWPALGAQPATRPTGSTHCHRLSLTEHRRRSAGLALAAAGPGLLQVHQHPHWPRLFRHPALPGTTSRATTLAETAAASRAVLRCGACAHFKFTRVTALPALPTSGRCRARRSDSNRPRARAASQAASQAPRRAAPRYAPPRPAIPQPSVGRGAATAVPWWWTSRAAGRSIW